MRLWYFFVLRNLIFQMRMCIHLMGLDVWFLVGPFVYFRSLCVRTVKALARLRGCAGSPEPSLVAFVISTIISWASSFHVVKSWPKSLLYELFYSEFLWQKFLEIMDYLFLFYFSYTLAGNLEELIKHGLRSLRDTLPSEVNLTSKVCTCSNWRNFMFDIRKWTLVLFD